MSEAKSGVAVTFVPGCRFAHPGYSRFSPHTLKIVSPRISRTRKITTKT